MKLGGGRTRDPGANEGCGAYDQDMLYMCVKFSTNKKGIVKIDPSIFPAMASSHFPVFNGFLGVMIIWLIQQLQEPTQINKIYTQKNSGTRHPIRSKNGFHTRAILLIVERKYVSDNVIGCSGHFP